MSNFDNSIFGEITFYRFAVFIFNVYCEFVSRPISDILDS